jgi:hypothetical protein
MIHPYFIDYGLLKLTTPSDVLEAPCDKDAPNKMSATTLVAK